MTPHNPEEEKLAQLVREGVRPQGFGERMQLAFDKLTGRVPRGVDARNPTMRKVIGGGFELLAVVKLGVFGGLLALIGLLFVWAGVSGKFDLTTTLVGLGLLAFGLYALKRGREAWRNFQVIRKA